jgi:excisionase family DNA binding protein
MAGMANIATGELLDELAARLAEPLAWRVVELLRHQDAADSEDHWLNTAEAAQYLGMSASRLGKLAASRAIPSEQDGPGCKRYFERSALDRWRKSGGASARLHRVV